MSITGTIVPRILIMPLQKSKAFGIFETGVDLDDFLDKTNNYSKIDESIVKIRYSWISSSVPAVVSCSSMRYTSMSLKSFVLQAVDINDQVDRAVAENRAAADAVKP